MSNPKTYTLRPTDTHIVLGLETVRTEGEIRISHNCEPAVEVILRFCLQQGREAVLKVLSAGVEVDFRYSDEHVYDPGGSIDPTLLPPCVAVRFNLAPPAWVEVRTDVNGSSDILVGGFSGSIHGNVWLMAKNGYNYGV